MVHQIGPAVGGVANAKGGQNRLGHPAPGGVLQRSRPLRGIELSVVKTGGFLVQRPQPLLLVIAGLIFLIIRHFHAHPLSQGTHRIGIAHALHFHLEIDDTAALMTAEAVIDALIRGHGEGGGLFPMEGTQAKHIGTGALEIDILAHHILNGILGDQFIDKRRGKCHRETSFPENRFCYNRRPLGFSPSCSSFFLSRDMAISQQASRRSSTITLG